VTHAHPFDTPSIAAEACNSGHIVVSRDTPAHTVSTVVRDGGATA